MRTVLLFGLIMSWFQPSVSWGGAPDFDKQSFMHEGLLKVEDDLLVLGRENLPQDSSCPAGGNQVFENMFWIKDSLFSALNSIDNLMDSVHPTLQEKQSEANRCGSCRQNNLVSSIATISPERVATVPECEGRPVETFRLNLKDKSDVKNFIQDLLRGRNSEGQRLASGCPDPCAYYVNTAQTELPNGDTHLTLTVQCGQPRRDSIFSARYEYNAGVIHQWSCSK